MCEFKALVELDLRDNRSARTGYEFLVTVEGSSMKGKGYLVVFRLGFILSFQFWHHYSTIKKKRKNEIQR